MRKRAVSRGRISEKFTDAQWSRSEPLIPRAKPRGQPRKTDMPAAMNANLYLLRTGCTVPPSGGRLDSERREAIVLESHRIWMPWSEHWTRKRPVQQSATDPSPVGDQRATPKAPSLRDRIG
jgi:Putative transposase of IS4/5 family (DUF4096)